MLLFLLGCGTEPPPTQTPCTGAFCPPEATVLTVPASGSGQLEAEGKRAVYAFQAQPGYFYRFTLSKTLPWTMELLAPSGQQVATEQDNYMGGLEVLHKPAVEGTYKLVVTHPGGAAASYDYQLSRSTQDAQGETLATGARIALGETTAGRLDIPADVDAFVWTGEARRIYRATVSGEVGSLSVDAADATNRPLGSASALSGATGESLAFSFTAPASGDLVLQVRGTNSLISRGEYTVRVEALGVDEHANFLNLATVLQVPTAPAASALDYPGDVDVLRFSATAGRIYRLRCTPGTLSVCRMALRGGGLLHEVASGQDELLYEASGSGDYILMLSGTGEGTYTYALEDVGTDDHADERASATTLPLGGSASGVVETPEDVDTFALGVQAGRLYRVTCSPGTLLQKCSVSVGGTDGLTAGYNANGARPGADFEAKSGQSYVAYVRGVEGATGDYRVALEDLGVDDHGDTAETASPLTLGVKVTGRMETMNDWDAFSVTLTVGTSYTLTSSGSPKLPVVTMVSANGGYREFLPGGEPFTPSSTAVHTLFVRSADSWGTESYELTVR